MARKPPGRDLGLDNIVSFPTVPVPRAAGVDRLLAALADLMPADRIADGAEWAIEQLKYALAAQLAGQDPQGERAKTAFCLAEVHVAALADAFRRATQEPAGGGGA